MLFSDDIFDLNRQLIIALLDIYAMHTGLPAALYIEKSGNIIWSTKNEVSSPLCRYLEEDPEHRCAEDHFKRCEEAKGIPEICHAGLWNLAMPVEVNNNKVATLISGQVRLKGENRVKESKKKFDSFLLNIGDQDKKRVNDFYYSTKEIEESDFNTHLMYDLANIQEYIYLLIYHRYVEDSAKRKKIQNLSHDFLLMVQAMLNKSEVLKLELEEKLEDKNLIGFADEVLKETIKLSYFTMNMVGSMMPVDKVKCCFQNVNTFDILNECTSLFQNEALNKGVVIYPPRIISKGPDTENLTFPIIEASEVELKRVFVNLINNAVKYSYSGTKELQRYISLIAYNLGDKFVIEISNYGTGIKEYEIKQGKIYEDGYRGELASDRNRTGSGVGLYEVQKILKKHNGGIDVKSEYCESAYKNTFVVSLPHKQK